MRLGQVDSFYIYNSERLLEFSKEYLGAKIQQESIDQIRSTKEISTASSGKAPLAVVLVENWLRKSNPDSTVVRQGQYPQLFLAQPDGDVQFYGVTFMKLQNASRDRIAAILGKSGSAEGDAVNVFVTKKSSEAYSILERVGAFGPDWNVLVGYKRHLANGRWRFQPVYQPDVAEA